MCVFVSISTISGQAEQQAQVAPEAPQVELRRVQQQIHNKNGDLRWFKMI